MKKTFINVLIFTAGAAIGSLVTWKVVKTKYERIAQEEIDSVKEYWADRAKERSENSDTEDTEWDEHYEVEEDYDSSEVFQYHRLANRYSKSGANAENSEEGEGEKGVPYINGPYVIAPNDFGDGNYDYSLHCLTYYSDGVLATDWDEKLDIEETIGEESLSHFGDYAEDVVHVRNERMEADYEVVRDPRTYTEVLAMNSPTQAYADRRPD